MGRVLCAAGARSIARAGYYRMGDPVKIKEAPEKDLPISKISLAAYNPRKDLKPGDPEYESIKRTLETFGVVAPLVWNERTGNLVGGHQRFKILKADGAKKVRVRVVDLPPAKEKALNIALNKVSGAWDNKKLASMLVELDDGDLDVTLTGFDLDEIKELVDDDAGAGVEGKVKFSEELGEANNYIVLVFRNDTDFLQAETLFQLESVYSRRRNGQPWAKGVGRVLSGPEAIEKIKAAAR
jgi:hypothetical protein